MADMMNRYRQMRAPFAEKQFLRQSGFKMLFGAGAALFGMFFFLMVFTGHSGADRYYIPFAQSSGGLARYLEENGCASTAVTAENPYGEEMRAIERTEQWTLTGGEWDSMPEETRSFLVLYADGTAGAWEFADYLSPSGARLLYRVRPVSLHVARLEPDENRRVWRENRLFLYYTGGNGAVEALLDGFAGEPVADGRESDPPVLWQAVSQFELPDGEREVQQMVVCILFGVLTGLFTLLAVWAARREKKENPAGRE